MRHRLASAAAPPRLGSAAAPPRLGSALALLRRYADGHRVTERARSGVARLAGLNASEQARFDRLIREAGIEVDAGGTTPGTKAPTPRERGTQTPTPRARGTRTPGPRAREAAPAPAGRPADPVALDLAHALEAARHVLEEDRRTGRPDTRLLGAAAEVGLSVLLRGGPARMHVEPDAEELAALPRDDLRRRAYECLVLHNQGLSRACAKEFAGRGLEDEDLLQHGMLGVMRAARRFDPARGFRFSSVAWPWVRHSMERGVTGEGTAIRIPAHMHERMRKVARAERDLQRAGRPRGVADVAVAADLSVRQVEEVRRISRVTDSLDREVGDGANLGDPIGARRATPSVVEDVLARLDAERLAALLARLTEREALVVRRRAGVFGEQEATLDEIGKDLGLTRERIRQIEGVARAKLLGFARGPRTGEPAKPARAARPKRTPRPSPPKDTPRPTPPQPPVPAPRTGRPAAGTTTRTPPPRPRPKAAPRSTAPSVPPLLPPPPRPAPRRRAPVPRPAWVYEGAPVLLLDGSRVHVVQVDEENSRVWWSSSMRSGPRHAAGFHVLRPAPGASS
ncbi:sigma-70 family RNA polymerase sigma factor [Streptomyces sp. NPDC058757]|uniref:sigma-70 family RNA polymerase sigma factor n=1 Tax=Streptomyces sp. NPDC058757 TaxID=3346626 RepID=UPI0036970814